ncbi:MAG: hypothetical protein WC997_02260 [Porticoccaceae bacterium]
MKPFDLEAAMRGAPIQTRKGRPAKFLAFVPEAMLTQRLVVLVGQSVLTICESGEVNEIYESNNDIFMAPKKRTVWVVRRPCGDTATLFERATKAEALLLAVTLRDGAVSVHSMEIEE